VIQSAAARAKPIALIFGILVSTVLTLVVIPVLYYVVQARQAR
jgi:multidrug efflux pump subunit AcrB